MVALSSGSDVSYCREVGPGCRFAHPSYACLFDDGGDEISPPPLEGEVDARSAAGGVTALTGARASGGAEHPTPPACGGRPSPCRGG
jgi:hypothetical protein